MTNRLDILIVEDDENDCNELIAAIESKADLLNLVGITNSSHDALDLIRDRKPNAVILDLELQEGNGDGMELLDKLHSSFIFPKPYIVVNTSSSSKVTRDRAKKLGADYSFAKWQQGYSPEMVINHLLLIMPSLCENAPTAPPNENQLQIKMRNFLQDEFNKLGLNVKNKGYKYLVDAVILTAEGEKKNPVKIIADKLGEHDDAIKHAMQYAINTAWKEADINNLLKYYTLPLRKKRYSPTTNEFIFYYNQKLIRYLNT